MHPLLNLPGDGPSAAEHLIIGVGGQHQASLARELAAGIGGDDLHEPADP
jgi:hypothetical protein